VLRTVNRGKSDVNRKGERTTRRLHVAHRRRREVESQIIFMKYERETNTGSESKPKKSLVRVPKHVPKQRRYRAADHLSARGRFISRSVEPFGQELGNGQEADITWRRMSEFKAPHQQHDS